MSSKKKTTATKDEARPALVPKLRFPEFRGAESWEPKTLAEICLQITNGKANAQDHEEDGDYPLFDRSAVIKKSSEFMFDAEAVILPGEGMRFVPKYFQGKFNLHQRAYALMRHHGDGRFVYHSLDYLQDALAKKAVKSTVLSLRLPIVQDFVIGCPKPAEQQKIAECLSAVDELMAAQARKMDALKTHKKGLMQQLFPREGETQPRLRFPEFQNAGEWSEGKLADIATVLQGYGFPERHQGQTSGDYPFYKVSDISRSLAAGKVFIEESANYINEDLLRELRAKPIPEGTTIFAKIGEAIRSNKRAITTAPCLIDNNTAGVKRIKGKATDLFIYLLMEQISLIDHAGGVVPAVNKSAIEEIVVKFPEPDEQERIASCLSSLDALITLETQKLEALKTHKKGLMQQLFPSPEEVEA